MVQVPLASGESTFVELCSDDTRESIRARAVGGRVTLAVEPTKNGLHFLSPVATARLTSDWQVVKLSRLPQGTRALRFSVENAAANAGALVELDGGTTPEMAEEVTDAVA